MVSGYEVRAYEGCRYAQPLATGCDGYAIQGPVTSWEEVRGDAAEWRRDAAGGRGV